MINLPVQVGFVPRIQFWFIFRRIIIVILHINRTKEKNYVVFSKDGEKKHLKEYNNL